MSGATRSDDALRASLQAFGIRSARQDASAAEARAERADARRELLQDALSEAVSGAMLVLSRDGTVAAMSRGAGALLGIDGEALDAVCVGDLVSLGSDAERFDCALRDGHDAVVAGATRRGAAVSIELRLTALSRANAPVHGFIVGIERSACPFEKSFHGIVWRSARIRELTERIKAFGPTRATVLILGESGAGKELVARALHREGPHPDQPFHAVNCAAIAETLLESELFGHERGAFTDAHREKAGRFEACGEGTLFLDEIGCLSPRLQAKLLRVLETREFERVGGIQPKKLRARVLAATNADLSAMVRDGSFRADLLYRINGLTLTVPPLREHLEDVPALAVHFVAAACDAEALPPRAIDDDALRALEDYPWPGNVRELCNALRYAAIVAHDGRIRLRDLPAEVQGAHGEAPPENATRGRIAEALQSTRFNRAAAAALLGMSRTTLWRRMRELGMV